jgi:hypothetical protein
MIKKRYNFIKDSCLEMFEQSNISKTEVLDNNMSDDTNNILTT